MCTYQNAVKKNVPTSQAPIENDSHSRWENDKASESVDCEITEICWRKKKA